MLEWLEHCVNIGVSPSLLVIFISVKCCYCNATVRPGHHLLDVSTLSMPSPPPPYTAHHTSSITATMQSSPGPGPPLPSLKWGHNLLALPQQQQLQLLLFCAPITLNLNPLQLIERRELRPLPAYFCAWELSNNKGWGVGTVLTGCHCRG